MPERRPPSPSYAAFIGGLTEARHACRLTQAQLAARLGKPQSYVSRVERLKRRLDVAEYCAIARAFGFRPAHLLTRIEGHLPP